MKAVAPLLLALLLLAAGCGSGSSTKSSLEAGIREQVAGHLAQADSDFLAIVSRDPHQLLAWYDLGVIAQQRQVASQAQHDYLQALAIDPRYVPALYNLALIEAVESPATAVRLFREVVADDPGLAAGHYNLGVVLDRQGDTMEGAAELAQARKADPRLVPPATTAPQPTTSKAP